MEQHIPEISVVVPTRNRGNKVVAAIDSILKNTHANYEVILVDQSTNSETADAIQPFLADPRFRYIHSETQGTGRARNVGLNQARGEIVAYTDDDCTVPATWLNDTVAIFLQNPRVAVIFCNIVAAPHNKAEGYIPEYKILKDRVLHSMKDSFWGLGIGAGMALRRDVIRTMGGFDNNLGPGSKFRSGEDHDIAIRSMINGWWVYETAAITITHYGYRSYLEGKEHTRRDAFSLGAAYVKPVKCGHWSAAVMFYSIYILKWLSGPLLDILHGKRPHGFSRSFYFIKGAVQGLRTSVDRKLILYQPQ